MTPCGPRHDAPRDGSCNCGLVSRHPAATPVLAGDEAIVAALAEVLDGTATGLWMGQSGPGWGRVVAVALLPVVRRFAEQRAAEEVLASADDIRQTTVLGHITERLERRAAALAATPNHGRNAT